ncbi:MAG: zinc ribbon domain-containing protein [Acidobacteria bacterium]|nr:zinc ribbon domain-containing protein [Acidobacteriota bacterium]
MPIYEYRCTECGSQFSRLQKIGAGSEGVKCPACESENVERQLSSFASTSGSPDVACSTPSSCSSGFS